MLCNMHTGHPSDCPHLERRGYTGDGQLTAIQLFSHLPRSGKKLSELASVMTRFPQTTINLKIFKEGKLAFYTDSEINAKIDEVKEALGRSGRILVRPSGTEPKIKTYFTTLGKDLAEAQAEKDALAEACQSILA